MVDLQTVLNAIALATTLEPQAASVVIALVTEVKSLFGAQDRASIDASLAVLDKAADDAHASAGQLGK